MNTATHQGTMTTSLTRELRTVDGTAPDWVAQVEKKIQLGQNFLLMVPNELNAVRDFCKVFELGPDGTPAGLTRSSLISLSLFIGHEDFDYLMAAEKRGDRVLYIEQLDLVMNRPPRVKPYLVYCPTWGIISQHHELNDARESYYDYVNSLIGNRLHSEAGIYKWAGQKWQMLLFR